MPSPLEGKPRSSGVSFPVREQLAKDIEAGGGPHEFDKGENPSLSKLLKDKQDVCGSHSSTLAEKKKTQNLINLWKQFETKEEWLEKVHIPLCLQGKESEHSDSNDQSLPDSEERQQEAALPPKQPEQKRTKPTANHKKKSNMATPSKKKDAAEETSLLFSSNEEAIEMVDHVIEADTDFPESHGHGFFCLRVPDALETSTTLGTCVSDELVIMAEDLIDLCDCENYNGQLVLNGRGFLLTKPSILNYLLKNCLALLSLEDKQCERTSHEFRVWISSIPRDKTRSEHETRLVLNKPSCSCSQKESPALPTS